MAPSRRRAFWCALLCAAGVALAATGVLVLRAGEPVLPVPPPASPAPATEPEPGSSTAPRFSPVLVAGQAAAADGSALRALEALPVRGRGPKTGYSREEFGQRWADVDRNGCDTRNDVLRRDLRQVQLDSQTNGCVVLTGRLEDPYTGASVDFVRGSGSDIHVDHVVALSDAWQKGAAQWSPEARKAFANDPANLLAVSARANLQKGDGDAATWLPPLRGVRCAYVAAQVRVKSEHRLAMTAAEQEATRRILLSC